MACGGNCGCKNKTSAAQTPDEHFVTLVEKDDYKEGDEIVFQFSATWCRPCTILKNTIKNSADIQKHFKDHTKGYWVLDIEDKDETTQAWVKMVNPGSVPMVVRFRRENGKWAQGSSFTGARNEQQVLAFLKSKWSSG